MNSLIKQMQINADADSGLIDALARHAAHRAEAAAAPGAIRRLALSMHPLVSRRRGRTIPVPRSD
jgi:hypothetical protein